MKDTTPPPAIITLDDVHKYYGDYHALRGISAEIRQGEFFSLLGPSGCGKTTLLRAIAGFEDISTGHIRLEGRNMEGVPPNKRPTNMVFQSYAIFPHLSVAENVAFGLRKKGMASDEKKRAVAEALEMVGLKDFGRRAAHALSGGQRQRVALARALILKPKVLLLDEPLSALDVSVQAAVTDLLMEIQRQNKTTLLFISHDLSIVRYLSDRVMVMYLGHVVELGTTDEVFAPPYHPYTEALLSAVPIADTSVEKKHIVLEGDIPSAMNPPPGCPFQTRCRWKSEVPGNLCETEVPPMRTLAEGHQIKCHLAADLLAQMEPVITITEE